MHRNKYQYHAHQKCTLWDTAFIVETAIGLSRALLPARSLWALVQFTLGSSALGRWKERRRTVLTETSIWSTETSAKPPKTTKYMEVTIRKAFIIRSISARTVLSLWTWQTQRHKTTSAYLFYYVYFPPICYISELALLLLIESCILNNSIKLHIFHPTQCRPLSKPQRLFCSSLSLVQYAKYSCQSASILDSIIAKQNVKNMRRVRTKKRYQQHSSLHTSVLI